MPHNTPNKPANKPPRPKNSIFLIIVIVALVTLGVSTSVSWYTLKNSVFTVQNMTATKFAAEGIQAVRLLRDFNNLKFQGNRDCWRMLPDKKAGDICNAQNSLVEGFYEIKPIPLSTGYTFIYLGKSEDQSFKPVSFSSGPALRPVENGIGTSGDSRFLRSIQIQFDPNKPDKMMTVTSTVKWLNSGQTQQVSLATIITNLYPNTFYEKK